MNSTIIRFLIRWFICTLGLWVASALIGQDKISYQESLGVITSAGLVLAIVNVVIKPIVVVLSLPALLFSLGLFMIIINAGMVLLASRLYEPLEVTNFSAALVAGIIIGLVNYLVTTVLDMEKK